ncbi:hypothetical protein CTEN210_18368 [Chaetoceros tenuissimus]|uniref:Leucine-rich repeat domain-containing protein n=1 Tax=Chaetoceros tenuissimus TaxID=426638 RepID=A0AAD3HFD8_9STRA|nr:hypothetical protein CTEN210_18368 [Chaetoceros tenuissimus]
MRVQMEEWRRFIPGVRMYKGKKTLFYNGEKLFGQPFAYDYEERNSWEAIVILPGVEVISAHTFHWCMGVKTVIMADSVRRIEDAAFYCCGSLEFVKLSRNLEYIGKNAFTSCKFTSIFVPPLCREIGHWAFQGCKKLIIFSVSENTELGHAVVDGTILARASPFPTDNDGRHQDEDNEQVNEWIKNRHADNQFSLHRACASHIPAEEVIYNIVKRQGIGTFRKEDNAGVSASQYLSQNPFTDIKEEKIMKRYILDMMGELV